jgi:hypothetical protein
MSYHQLVTRYWILHNPTRRRLGRSDISIREPVREVCLNSARQLITRGYGKEQNTTKSFRKCLQLLRNVQLEKRVGWTQNPPTFGSWGFNSPSRHHSQKPRGTRLPATLSAQLIDAWSFDG